jgi:phosphoribosylformylglycinamidine synthase PurS subunit
MAVTVNVTIKLKRGVADPEGENTRKALQLLGFKHVQHVRSMKTFQLVLESEAGREDDATVRREVEEMCRKLLANPVIHDYAIDIVARERS